MCYTLLANLESLLPNDTSHGGLGQSMSVHDAFLWESQKCMIVIEKASPLSKVLPH